MRRGNYVTGKCLLLVFLFFFAWTDLKKRELPMLLLGICGLFGILFLQMTDTLVWQELLGGLCVGGGMLLFALASKESVGVGDGLLFCVTGIYLGLWQNLLLLFGAVLFCAAAGAVLLLRKKCTRKQQIPFAPFVLIADVALLFFMS
ncbi:MAG: prepilin peptidase [Clostridiales bacterium]|nr:prepilin peptidase [Clostridiales bacterium]